MVLSSHQDQQEVLQDLAAMEVLQASDVQVETQQDEVEQVGLQVVQAVFQDG